MLHKGSRHWVLQFLQARKADWHVGNYMTNDWQLLVVKIQNSDIYAEFGPCYSLKWCLLHFFPNHMLKIFIMQCHFSKFPLEDIHPLATFLLSTSYYLTLFWYARLYTKGERPLLPQRVHSQNCSCFFPWWHLWSESIYSVWLDSEELRFW